MRVAVIGAGIAGLLIATELRRRGHEVLVIDRAAVGGVAPLTHTRHRSPASATTSNPNGLAICLSSSVPSGRRLGAQPLRPIRTPSQRI